VFYIQTFCLHQAWDVIGTGENKCVNTFGAETLWTGSNWRIYTSGIQPGVREDILGGT